MLKYLRIGVSALALAAFVVAPLMTIATADYAYAKNGNGNGGGKGGGNGGGKGGGNGGDKGGDRGGDKGANKGNNGKGHDKSSNGRTAGNGNKAKGKSATKGKGFARSVKDDFKSLKRNVQKHGVAGLFKPNKQTKTTKRASYSPTKVAPKKSTRPAHRAAFKADPMHPSNLGKLNGAINSSPNAKAAHIANGQYAKGTGPVSMAAALAVADYNLDGVNASLEAYNEAVTTVELAAAFALLDEVDMASQTIAEADTAIADADAVLNDEMASEQAKLQAAEDKALAEAQKQQAQAFVDTTDTTEAAALTDGQEEPGDITEAQATVDAGLPSEQEVADAEQAVADAEDNLLASYKGDLPASEDPEMRRLSGEEQNVVDAVRASNPDEATVEAALGAAGEGVTDDTAADTEGVADDDSTVEDTLDETDAARLEEVETSEQG